MLNAFQPLRPFKYQWPAVFGGSLEAAIRKLFADPAVQGAWYDPSDLPTLYTERTGASATTPSVIGGVVGTVRDKSGNHYWSTAPSDAARPLLGREPEGGARNLFINTSTYGTGWVAITGSSFHASEDSSPADSARAYGGRINASAGDFFRQNYTPPEAGTYVFSQYAKYHTGQRYVCFTDSVANTGAYFDLIEKTVAGVFAPGGITVTQGIEDVGNGWVRCWARWPVNTSLRQFRTYISSNINEGSVPLAEARDGTERVLFSAPQLEKTSAITPYQRVGASSRDVTEAGKRDNYYLFGGRLEATFPDMGDDATYIYGSQAGIGESEDVTINGLTELIRPEKNFGMIYYEQPFTADQKALVKQYICRNTPNCDEFDFAGGDQIIDYTDGGIDYRAHVFTTSGHFVANEDVDVEYLVIAGGGGGQRGAGGAGGYRCSVQGEMSGGGAAAESVLSLAAGSYVITIGAGGQGQSSDGSSSSITSLVTTVGGGASSDSNNVAGGPGGSGSGASNLTAIGDRDGGAGTAGQGFRGGNVINTTGAFVPGAAGGGAGSAGGDRTNGGVSAPGAGVSSSITGTAVTRAQGGDVVSSVSRAANSGSGAHRDSASVAGSGIVVIRYQRAA
jgi:hypothetical protein